MESAELELERRGEDGYRSATIVRNFSVWWFSNIEWVLVMQTTSPHTCERLHSQMGWGVANRCPEIYEWKEYTYS